MYLNPRMVGSGERTLVLSHGYGASQAIWDKVLPHLSRRNKVFLFDWDFSGRGVNGEAEEGEHGCYTFSRFADELVALMDEMKLSRAVYIGHSMAGMVGCIASVQRPDLFAHLVLVGASPRYMNSEDYEGGFDASDIEEMLASISSDFGRWAEGFVPLAVGIVDPWAVERLARSFFAMDPRAAYELARMIFLGDQREVLDHVAVPCTLVHVSRDFAAPPCVGRYMQARMLAAARCAGAAMVTIDSVGHFPQLVAPDELLEILNLVLGGASDDGRGEEEEPPVLASRAADAMAVGEMNGEVMAHADAEVNSDIGLAPQAKLLV